MKPHILQVISDPGLGGVRSSVESLATSSLSEEFDLTVHTATEAQEVLRKEGAALVVVNDASSWANLKTLFDLKQHTRGLVVWEHHYCQGFETINVPIPSRFHAMLRLSYGLANCVLGVSEAQVQWMLDQHLLDRRRLRLIQQCRALQTFLAIAPKLPGRPLVLGAYGRFCPQKGFDLLLDAMVLVGPADIVLEMAGSGPDEEALRSRARNLPNVTVHGPLTDVPAFLEKVDIVVIPSRWEPWGNVCLEAKAAGKPVIVSDVDGLHEQVQGCGLLVAPGDIPALAEAIRSLPTRDLERWSVLARASVRTAWERYLEEWQSLIREIVA